MKHLMILATVASLLFSCAQTESMGSYGDAAFETTNAIAATEALIELGEASEKEMVVKGSITSVCQSKGCWMKMDLGNDQQMRIKFKDYGFFVPMNSSGETAVINGKMMVEEISVAMLKEFALDAGKSQEEIDAITEPKIETSFEASGVIFE